eukprot:TRINITY_DN10234_c0_g4_i1.p1 TRINITY_DN10234_c0_g4~~TRINITY_DN10234_c0_g4_i1.p1  ORF type:complete len:308 (+),score=37.15 TRINITY_DN10234_c0_g4_i1:60-983(+)
MQPSLLSEPASSKGQGLPRRKGIGVQDSRRSPRREEAMPTEYYNISKSVRSDDRGTSRSRSPAGTGSPPPASPAGRHQHHGTQNNVDLEIYSNRLLAERYRRQSRRIVTQGETVVTQQTNYPPLKTAVGMVAGQGGTYREEEFFQTTKEVMTSTNGSLAKALKDLALLYRDGDLTFEEYNYAKQQVISGEGRQSLAAMLDEEGSIDEEPAIEVTSVRPVGYYTRHDEPDRKDRQIAALIDENSGLRAVTDRLQTQITSGKHYPTPTPQALPYDVIPTKPSAKPVTPPKIPETAPQGDWSLHTLRSPV